MVTGASRGIGEAIVDRLVAEGYRALALARSSDALDAIADRHGDRVVPRSVDVRDARALARIVDEAEGGLGPIEALVNNASVFRRGALHEQSIAEIDEAIDVNLKGALYATRLVLPAMRARRRGTIVNIASVVGYRAMPGQASYCVSKFGILGLGDAVGQEVVGDGIRVATICPGATDTPLWDPHAATIAPPERRDRMLRPAQVADAVAFALTAPPGTVVKSIVLFPDIEWF